MLTSGNNLAMMNVRHVNLTGTHHSLYKLWTPTKIQFTTPTCLSPSIFITVLMSTNTKWQAFLWPVDSCHRGDKGDIIAPDVVTIPAVTEGSGTLGVTAEFAGSEAFRVLARRDAEEPAIDTAPEEFVGEVIEPVPRLGARNEGPGPVLIPLPRPAGAAEQAAAPSGLKPLPPPSQLGSEVAMLR